LAAGRWILKSKDDDIVPMTVRILRRTVKHLDALAKADLRSTSNLVRKILEDYVREHGHLDEPWTASSMFATDDDDEEQSASGSAKDK
jgi:hypothetical protein